MPDWRAAVHARLTPLRLSPRRESDIAEELAQHLEDRYTDLRSRGHSEDDALRIVRDELAGDALANALTATERSAARAGALAGPLAGEHASGDLLSDLWRDVRYGIRALRNAPGFTAVAIVTLALGIGATTAMFTVFSAVLLRPLPFPQPEHLVRVYQTNDKAEGGIGSLSMADYRELRQDDRVFSSIATYMVPSDGFSLVVGNRPERVFGTVVGASFFTTLGIRPLLGSVFRPGDDAQGAPALAVLSYGFWQGRLGGDPAIVGKQLSVEGAPVTVTGVMPPNVWFPRSEAADIWLNDMLPTPSRQGPWGWQAIARVRPEVTPAQLTGALDRAAERVRSDFPGGPAHWTFVAKPVPEQLSASLRPALLVLMAAVVLVLLIACLNVTNLMLARATSREHEFAVRTALGASRGRLIRQLVTESVLLAFLGGTAGVLLAVWGVRALVASAPASLALLRDLKVGVDGQVLLVAAAVSMGSVLLFGLAPALLGAPSRGATGIGSAARGSTDGRGRRHVRSLLVGAEFAFSLVLLVTAGLLVRSLGKLLAVDTGLHADGVVTASIALPKAHFGQSAQILGFHDRLLAAVRSVPGVTIASASVGLPPDVLGYSSDFFVVGQPVPDFEFAPLADVIAVDGEYFAAMGIPLRSGRVFDARDDGNGPQTVMISTELARRFFPHSDPLGQRLSVGGKGAPNEYTIVGVAGDVPYEGLARGASSAMYFPFAQFSQGQYRSFTVVIRSAVPMDDVAAVLRTAVQRLDPELAVAQVRTVRDLVDASVSANRFRAMLLGLFAVLALILAAVGIYGVMAFSVGRRSREIGVRMALGAGTMQLYAQILREGLTVAGAGIAVGLAVAFGVTRVASTLLFGVSATDPLTFAAVALILILIAAIACLIPARRAASVDPAITMVTD
jgi:putative ABC transport system permease protein